MKTTIDTTKVYTSTAYYFDSKGKLIDSSKWDDRINNIEGFLAAIRTTLNAMDYVCYPSDVHVLDDGRVVLGGYRPFCIDSKTGRRLKEIRVRYVFTPVNA